MRWNHLRDLLLGLAGLVVVLQLMGNGCSMAPEGDTLLSVPQPPAPPEDKLEFNEPEGQELAWYQLSPDDSTSMATAQILKQGADAFLGLFPLHPHEVLNYYDPPTTLREAGLARSWALADGSFVGLDARRSEAGAEGLERLELLVHIYAPPVAAAARRPWNLHLCVDVSGSMSGDKIEMVRDALLLLLDAMQAGDRLSLTVFSTEGRLELGSRQVGSERELLRQHIEALEAENSTNMIEGLRIAYAEAARTYDPATVNRVLLFSDGAANVGDTDIETFAEATRRGEQEGIYLSGVGVGGLYDGRRMDALTDAGKGAHVFLPNPGEVEVVFGKMLPKLIEVAADEVAVEVALPAAFTLESFSGEEVSTDPEQRVPNIVLAAGDDLTMLASFTTARPTAFQGEFELTFRYRPLHSAEPQSFTRSLTVAELLGEGSTLLQRTRLVHRYGAWAAGKSESEDPAALLAEVEAFAPQDAGLIEIAEQIRRLQTP